MPLNIGDTIYRFDVNRRVYPKGKKGESTGGPIYAEHFEAHTIGSETKHSWLVTDGYGVVKVNKKTMRQASKNGWGGYQWFSAQAMSDNIWRNEHRHNIRIMLDNASPSQLRKVAEILGYEAAMTTPETTEPK